MAPRSPSAVRASYGCSCPASRRSSSAAGRWRTTSRRRPAAASPCCRRGRSPRSARPIAASSAASADQIHAASVRALTRTRWSKVERRMGGGLQLTPGEVAAAKAARRARAQRPTARRSQRDRACAPARAGAVAAPMRRLSSSPHGAHSPAPRVTVVATQRPGSEGARALPNRPAVRPAADVAPLRPTIYDTARPVRRPPRRPPPARRATPVPARLHGRGRPRRRRRRGARPARARRRHGREPPRYGRRGPMPSRGARPRRACCAATTCSSTASRR